MSLKDQIIRPIFTNFGLAAVVFATYIYHTDLKKVEYNILDKKQEVAENYFPNPPILEIEWQANDQGYIETYLVNKESGKKQGILNDMLPENKILVEALKERISDGFVEGLDKKIIDVFEHQAYTRNTANSFEEMLGYIKQR
jgi:hypothetical protein